MPDDSPSLSQSVSPPVKPKRRLRLALMLLGLLAVGVGAAAYALTGLGEVSTEDAYVKAPIVAVAPEVTGTVQTVAVVDNQAVARGDVLLRLDPRPFVIARDQAQAHLDAARAQVEELKARLRTKHEEEQLARTSLAYAEKERRRQEKLATAKVVSESRLEDAREAAESARLKIAVLQREQAEIVAALGGAAEGPVDTHPSVRAAAATLAEAELNLERTALRAPVAGVVGHLPRIGDTVAVGKAALSLVGTEEVWVEANFKETDLTWMRPGQPVRVGIDTYPDLELSGRVESISQASGAEFSVLPAQNATGNWVKVVQRIPVRVALDVGAGTPPLRSGMSAEVVVDTGHRPDLPAPLADLAEEEKALAEAAR